MADKSIGAAADQLMAFLARDRGAPIFAKMYAGPRGEEQAGERDHGARACTAGLW